jgi:hypothetical protein
MVGDFVGALYRLVFIDPIQKWHDVSLSIGLYILNCSILQNSCLTVHLLMPCALHWDDEILLGLIGLAVQSSFR